MKRFCLYRHFDKNGKLLYVGCSWSVFMRNENHKTSYWFNQITTITIERFGTCSEALKAEKRAIEAESPAYNGGKWIEEIKQQKGGIAFSNTTNTPANGLLHCNVCKYAWSPRLDDPIMCPKCKSRKWHK